jgi:hypothetical protein
MGRPIYAGPEMRNAHLFSSEQVSPIDIGERERERERVEETPGGWRVGEMDL